MTTRASDDGVTIITGATLVLIQLRAARRDLVDWQKRYGPQAPGWWERPGTPPTSGLPVEHLRWVDEVVRRLDAEIARVEGPAA